MSDLRVSIAMTTFDGRRHVEAQLDSFLAQTRPPDQLIVCDDGSTDGTRECLDEFAARAPFAVRVVRNPVQLATTPNFEQAVSLTDGDVVFFSDQDDVWHPDRVASLVEVFEAHEDAGCAFSNARVVDGEGAPLGYALWDSLWFSQPERAAVSEGRPLEVFARHVVAAGTSLAFRGRFRELILPFPDLHDCHDAWVSFLVTAASGVRLVERDLLDYRLHGQNQFGLQRFNLRQQLGKARWQLQQGIFAHNVRFFEAVRDRLHARAAEFPTGPDVFDLIEAKIAHATRRDAMSSSVVQRLPAIAGELRNRGYWRFAYGWKSVAQDVLLR